MMSIEEIRITNRNVFADTLRRIESNDTLKTSLYSSIERTVLYPPEAGLGTPHMKYNGTEIIVSNKRTAEAASGYHGKKVTILNFASAWTPGGGVLTGSSAQEESLCRISTLYPALKDNMKAAPYYAYHRAHLSCTYSDMMIFTPDILFFKSDTAIPEMMDKGNWFKADVITAAAPNLTMERWETMQPERQEEIKRIIEKRIERIYAIAAIHNTEVLILGAFGCGAFHNPPQLVAECFRKVQEKYENVFRIVEFAIFTSSMTDNNFNVFRNILTINSLNIKK